MDHLRVIEGVILDSDSESEMLISSAIDELGIGLTEAEPIQIADFPACPESICGSVMRKCDIVQVGDVVQQRRCICGFPTVVGRNKDRRAYLACPQKRCKFFRWADTALDPPYYNLAHNKVSWKAFSPPVYKLLPSDLASLPEYVVQGSLGDCWFLSALVVFAKTERGLTEFWATGTVRSVSVKTVSGRQLEWMSLSPSLPRERKREWRHSLKPKIT